MNHWLLILVSSTALGCAGLSLEHVLQRDLRSEGSLSCAGQLAWNHSQVQHVVLALNGTGVYSSAFVHPAVEDALSVNPVAYLTFDKPGIRAPFQDPAALTVNEEVVQHYTQGHMLECARDALSWSEQQFGQGVRFHFRGHSEGTLIALFLYEKLLAEEPERAGRVSSLVLSGLGLEPFATLVERQLQAMPDGRTIRTAIEHCDWGVLRSRMAVSCDYLQDAYARPSGRETFEQIARRAPRAKFFVFQGNHDFHTPARYTRDLEVWNEQAGNLQMTFRYYEGAHAGAPPDAQREMSELLVRLTAPAPRVVSPGGT